MQRYVAHHLIARWGMRKGMSMLLANRSWLILLGLVAFVTAGCGGGGGSSLSSSGGAVNVSLAAVPQDSAAAPLVGTTATDPLAKPMPPDGIDHVWITIHRVALIPGSDGTVPDPSGETSVQDSGPPEPGHVNGDISPPEEVDLLDLPVGIGARFLNTIDNVPAGTYGKIRLYYSDPKVHFVDAVDNTATHPTANYHLDIHFKGGDLVIPVATGSEGGVIVHDVTVYFVLGKDGLKINVNPNKILMRPQVFATVGTVQYVVSGIADNVDKMLSTFDIATVGGRSFHAMYDDIDTMWAFKDNETMQQVAVDNNLGIAALRDGSLVDVYGAFTGIETLFADDVVTTFTEWREDRVAPGDEPPPSGWQFVDPLEFFEFRFSGDNVVIPMPSRTEARYDNNADLSQTFSDAIIVDNTLVRARGYFVLGEGIDAFWISWVGGP
jgi:hypothetical protein